MTPGCVYRMYAGDGALLYVGSTIDGGPRIGSHRYMSDWWREVARIEIEHFPTRREALDAEVSAIRAERPAYNVQCNDALNARACDGRALRERGAA